MPAFPPRRRTFEVEARKADVRWRALAEVSCLETCTTRRCASSALLEEPYGRCIGASRSTLRFPTLLQYTTVHHPCQGIGIPLLGGYGGVIDFPPHTSPAGTLQNRLERERRAGHWPADVDVPLSHVRASQDRTRGARPCPRIVGVRDLDRDGRQPHAPGPTQCGRYHSKPARALACHLQRCSLHAELVRKRLSHTRSSDVDRPLSIRQMTMPPGASRLRSREKASLTPPEVS
jgi:hypothetical protein